MLVLNKLKKYVLKHELFIDEYKNNSFIWTINNEKALYCKYTSRGRYGVNSILISYYKNNIKYPCLHILECGSRIVILSTTKTTWKIPFDMNGHAYCILTFDNINNTVNTMSCNP